MKIRLVEGMTLIITPESYPEQVALGVWCDLHIPMNGTETGILIEGYRQNRECPVCRGGKGAWVDGHWTDCIVCSGTGEKNDS